MKKLILSTDGTFQGREVQHVEAVDYRRQYHPEVRHVAEIDITPQQAYNLAAELLYVAVDAGVITGWSVSFPEPLPSAEAEIRG